jgi:hypothetical protein
MSIADRDEFKELLQYPLLQALAHRRARRFPLGCHLPGKSELNYASEKTPLGLSELETALLCWAGNGVTGCISADLPTSGGNLFGSWLGRTTPYACNVHNTRLFYTDDAGTYMYHPDTVTKPVSFETAADWDAVTDAHREGTTRVLDERVEFVPKTLLRSIHWNTNQPGTTVFIPVVDQTMEYIDFLLGVFDYEGYGYQLFDGLQGNWAGLKELIEDGKLKGPKVEMASFEYTILGLNLSPAYMMLQNIHLMAEAMGLGAVVFGGYTGTVMLGATPMSQGLGFRIKTDRADKANPVGLDGVFEAYCPPFYPDMDAAVDAFCERKFGPGGVFSADYPGQTGFKDWPRIQPEYHHPSKASIAMVKAYCRHVYETYGRFPATYDTKVVPIWLQVHHLDTDFYDANFPAGMLTEAHREHLARWHGA